MNVSGINQNQTTRINNQTTNSANTVSFAQQLAASQAALTTKAVTAQQGDTVWGFAQKYGSTVQQIAQKNHLQNPNLILIGQKLQVPVTNSTKTTQATQAYSVNQTTNNSNTQKSSTSSNITVPVLNKSEEEARAYIVQHESGGNYNARNGKYIGKYQLDSAYLNGDYSSANQEKVAAKYVAERYGNWENAMKHWETYSWY
ncbi:MAG: LysM peptidoglycan-binding domain-containing protein [Liquorilactobacillus nagelii]|mgnify:FL=1|jgi:murein DD-endopeptidase MepM/ murein hydrolase activator NlpD|uniref:LysM peptidoglycan-binding domain-containing protein n=1 Tax=Liquorilactobacillus nagelii TaxID=82688 RepID=UPI0024310500|nr:LysM peptidoglycan-binding domain-containing protein [Liquorilactobacillus nagelii]MCI1632608.1 LysM peptidoglycan-binding domain-containing protein [Liquorilactobacillus nagelii]MCI1920723.1 LysM peptidoglycan-binding domain-containing protein [Liquorilactobacillus nagelii]MCI1977621.1 LysM peptidoglycan-binding domain-containing protein [Liquorilactobacillus nagelii]